MEDNGLAQIGECHGERGIVRHDWAKAFEPLDVEDEVSPIDWEDMEI